VRQHLWARGAGPLFPVEVEVANEPDGRPTATIAGGSPPVSVAHKDDVAVAIAGDPGEDVGIDIETIEPRTAAFTDLAFTPRELALAADPAARDERLARLWAAKEAVAKLRGTGITDPKRFEVRPAPAAASSAAGASSAERFAVGDDLVETARHGDHVVAWARRARP
jgi:phosphopantetheinyl transferase